MSAPLTRDQIAFELPQLSYIDTRWEEPVVARPAAPGHRFADWLAARIAALRTRSQNRRARGELAAMSERELFDIGLNRGDLDRMFDDRFNQDLVARCRAF